MYIPTTFVVSDPERLTRFMNQNSFATVVSQEETGTPFASHVPLLYEPEPKPAGLLLGHLARANPQWRHFETQREVLVIFQGPHAYISPRWYSSSPAVPTWNYTAVHVYGVPHLITLKDRLQSLVQRMVQFYEGEGKNAWNGDLPAEYLTRQLNAIVGFEIRLTRLEGKFKLGQNRSKEDLQGVYTALSQSGRVEDRILAQFMREEGVV